MSGRRIVVPLATPPASRPQAPAEPCAACGADVDPLRAARVIAFEDGIKVLCGEECFARYRAGARSRKRAAAAPRTPAKGSVRPPATTPASGFPAAPAPPEASARPAGAERRLLWAGLSSVCLAALLSPIPRTEAAVVALCLCLGATVVALRLSAHAVREIGLLGWLLGPAGAACAAVAAYQAQASATGGALGVLGAALAAAAQLGRARIDLHARGPVDDAVTALLARLPREVLVPLQDATDPLVAARRRVEAARVRTGEEILVTRGQVIAVDGVVQLGEGSALPYPGATTPIRRRVGDPVLAGATLVDGTLRVLATRVGDDRALARVARFAQPAGHDGAPLLRVSDRAVRAGSAVVLAVALAVYAATDADAFTSPLSAMAAILIAAPLLALRRAAQWPFVSAAATAGARGIVFQSGQALEHAGHVSLVAMAPHRTLTEGKPEVVEAHFFGDGDGRDLLALIAAAEQAAGEHPIARAIAAFAHTQGLPALDVRRAVRVAGRGVTAIAPGGEEVVIGSRRLLLDHGVSIATADAEAARAEAAGRTAIFVSVAGRVRALLVLQDHLRVGARAAIQRMFDMGLEVVLLTGQQRGPIEELALGLDIAHVKAELLPEERGHEVRSLREAGARVAVIGFPVEDDAALSAADVGIALGAAGGPAGDRAVALVSEDVRDAAAALWIAQAAREGALTAVRLAAAVYALAIAATVTGLLEPGVAAVLALLVDAYAIRTGPRLLRRIALRLPAWT